MTITSRLTSLIILFWLCCSYSVYATVTGTVTDSYGKTVPVALVTFTDETNINHVYSAMTDSSGVYTLEYYEVRPPTDIVITDIAADQGHTLQLSWSLSPDDNIVTNYNIYRSRSETITEAVSVDSFSSLDELIAAEETATILIGSVSAGVNGYTDNGVPLNGTVYYYWIEAVSGENTSAKAAAGYLTAVEDNMDSIPQSFSLSQNYPNPFNPTTTIPFALDRAGHIELAVFNVLGQNVRTLINGHCDAGIHTVSWDGLDENGGNAGAGIYLYRLQFSGRSETKKMLLIDGGAGSVAGGSASVSGSLASKAVRETGRQIVLDSKTAYKGAAQTYAVNITHDSIVPYEESGILFTDGGVYDFTATADYVVIENDTDPEADQPETDDDTLAGDLNTIIGQNSAAKPAFDIPDIPDNPDIPDIPVDPIDLIDTAGNLITLTAASSPCLGNLTQMFGTVPVADILALNLPVDELAPLISDAAALVMNTGELTEETIASIMPIIEQALTLSTPLIFENSAVRDEYLSGIVSQEAVDGVKAMASLLGFGIASHLSVVLPDSLDPTGASHRIITLGVDHIQEVMDASQYLAEGLMEDEMPADPLSAPPAEKTAKTTSIEVDYQSYVREGGYLPDNVINTNPVQYRSYRIEPWESTQWRPESHSNIFYNDIDFTVQLWGDFENSTKFIRIFTPDSGGFKLGHFYTVMEQQDKGYYQGATYVRIETIYDNSLNEEPCDWFEEDMSSPNSRDLSGPRLGNLNDFFGESMTYFRDYAPSNGYPRFRYKSNPYKSAIQEFRRNVEDDPWDMEITRWEWNGQRISWRHGIAYAYHPNMEGLESDQDLRHPMLYTVPPQNHYLEERKLTSWDKMVVRRDWASDYILIPTDLGQSGWRPQVQVILKNAERPDSSQRFRFKTTQYARRTYLDWGDLKHRVKKSVKWRTFMVDFSKVGPGN